MSILSDNIKELLIERNLNNKSFASSIGLSAGTITNYIKNEMLPTVENLVKIADYFNCSIDYLLGKREDNTQTSLNECPPFSERLVYLRDYFNFSNQQIYSHPEISKSRYYDWLSGKRVPTLESVIALAEIFDCSVDFIIGREN